jgi:hypothetical protein
MEFSQESRVARSFSRTVICEQSRALAEDAMNHRTISAVAALAAAMAVQLIALVRPAWADPVDLPGVADVDYYKNGIKTVAEILTILNPNPVDGLSPKTSMTFAETPSQAFLTLAGGNFGTPDTTQTFKVNGSYWGLTFSVTQDAAAVVGFDSVAVSGSFYHLSGPHGGDGLGTPFTYNLLFEFDSPGCCTTGQTVHKTNRHIDSFDAGLGGTFRNVVVPVVGTILSSDITTWNFTASAIHAIPEPSLAGLMLAGLALLGIVVLRRWHRCVPDPH